MNSSAEPTELGHPPVHHVDFKLPPPQSDGTITLELKQEGEGLNYVIPTLSEDDKNYVTVQKSNNELLFRASEIRMARLWPTDQPPRVTIAADSIMLLYQPLGELILLEGTEYVPVSPPEFLHRTNDQQKVES